VKSNYLLQFFGYKHLPEKLQAISKPFGDLAQQLFETLPENPEKTTARANLFKD
jgi:hypothetical protein